MVPQESCEFLMTGWDFGPVNPAVAFIEPFMPKADGKEHFKVIDEIALRGVEISVREFTQLVLEKMLYWQDVVGRPIRWLHWSDRSAFDDLEPISLTYQHEEVFAASEGRIALKAVERGRGSVAARVRLWRRLLHENRLFFSAAKAPEIIAMHRQIRPGRTPYSIATNDPYKHIFDAASYAIAKRCWDEIEDAAITVLKRGRERVTKYVPVPL
jgi:hypothetical protein